MSTKRILSISSLSAGLYLCLTLGAAQAGPVPAAQTAISGAVGNHVEDVQFRGRRVGGARIGGGRVYGGRRFGGRAVGAGIAAGVIGGLIGGALLNSGPAYAAPEPVYEAPPVYGVPVYRQPRGGSVEYCMRRYRSYDPNTGTYVGLDGIERPCP